MWKGFDPTAYSQDAWLAHVVAIKPSDMTWKPIGVTLHNTGAPTLGQWAESGPAHDARLRNLQKYYESNLGWHHGPHAFISRTRINGFSPLSEPGVHSTCFNRDHFGIEMVGDYEPGGDAFASGDGALVRNNAIWALAVLHKKFGFDPERLTFHRDCPRDRHACPGSQVEKEDIIMRVKTLMNAILADSEVVS